MKTKIIGSLLMVFFLTTVLFAAQPPDFGKGKIHGLKMLDLTEDQKTQIAQNKLQLEKEAVRLRSEMNKLRSDLKLEMIADNFDEGKVKIIVSNLTELEEELKVKRLLNQRSIRDLLTSEQKQKFDLFILSRDGKGKKSRHDFRRPEYRKPMQGN